MSMRRRDAYSRRTGAPLNSRREEDADLGRRPQRLAVQRLS